MKQLLIDGDPLVYRCGFAAELHEYDIVYEQGDSPQQIRFSPQAGESAGAQMKAWLESNEEEGGFQVLDKTKIVTPQSVSFALEAAKTQIESILTATGAKNGRIFISGSANYRYAIAKQRPYKGNRHQDRPVHYDAIRQYLSKFWGAELVDKIEADDRISILAREEDSIVATIDKDLDQIPGSHYNYMKQVSYEMDAVESELFFYQQCLSGDPTDNIPGCYKIGPTKARAKVNISYAYGHNFERMWGDICNEYAKSVERDGCPYSGQNTREVALETARLVKLQEYDGQLWTPIGELSETVTEKHYG